MDKLTALVLLNNEGQKITILCRSWGPTKDGIIIRSLDNSYISFSSTQYTFWGFQDVSVNLL